MANVEKTVPKLLEQNATVLHSIDTALMNGFEMHVFLSGGGLRVVRIEEHEEDKTLKGYGEYANLLPAIIIAAKDYEAGQKPYTTHYLTGSSHPTDSLDAWLLRGRCLDAFAKSDQIVLSATKYDGQAFKSVTADTFIEAYAELEEEIRTTNERPSWEL